MRRESRQGRGRREFCVARTRGRWSVISYRFSEERKSGWQSWQDARVEVLRFAQDDNAVELKVSGTQQGGKTDSSPAGPRRREEMSLTGAGLRGSLTRKVPGRGSCSAKTDTAATLE